MGMNDYDVTVEMGAGIDDVLAASYSYPEVVTELVKNGIQNDATRIEISLDRERGLFILKDDGAGFSYNGSMIEAFQLFLRFGNSIDMRSGDSRYALGAAGLGGKIALGKLSQGEWSIMSRNAAGERKRMTFAPGEVEVLSGYQPDIEDVPNSEFQGYGFADAQACTIIVIENVEEAARRIVDASYINELRSFFTHLILNDDRQPEIAWNGSPVPFDFDVQGYTLGHDVRLPFSYSLPNEPVQTGLVKATVTIADDIAELESVGMAGVQVHSMVKIGALPLPSQSDLQDVAAELETTTAQLYGQLARNWHSLAGTLDCVELSSVLYEGFPAKDLSHQSLRSDHPVTAPYLKTCYEWLARKVFAYEREKQRIELESFDFESDLAFLAPILDQHIPANLTRALEPSGGGDQGGESGGDNAGDDSERESNLPKVVLAQFDDNSITGGVRLDDDGDPVVALNPNHPAYKFFCTKSLAIRRLWLAITVARVLDVERHRTRPAFQRLDKLLFEVVRNRDSVL